MSRSVNLSQGLYGQMNRAMTAEQFDQVVTAIVEGKYSWACVLILRYAGYNPAHYLPYRTYKRLVKDNRPRPQTETPVAQPVASERQTPERQTPERQTPERQANPALYLAHSR